MAAGKQMPTPAYGTEWTPRCMVKSGSLSKELSQPEFARQPHCKSMFPAGCAQRGLARLGWHRRWTKVIGQGGARQGRTIGQVYEARHSMSSVISALLPNLMGIP